MQRIESRRQLGQRYLVLGREVCSSTFRLREVLTQLGKVAVILDASDEDGIWYPDNEVYGGIKWFLGATACGDGRCVIVPFSFKSSTNAGKFLESNRVTL